MDKTNLFQRNLSFFDFFFEKLLYILQKIKQKIYGENK